MTGRVAENRVSTCKHRPRSLLLTLHGCRIRERTIGAECLVHEVDSDQFAREAGELSDTNLDGFHGDEDRLLVLTKQELSPSAPFHRLVEALLKAMTSTHVRKASL